MADPIKQNRTYTRAEYNAICATAGWTGDDVFHAAAIAWRESRGRPTGTPNPIPVGLGPHGCSGKGSHHATGMFQIVPACWPKYDEHRLQTDPLYNATSAHDMFLGSGWKPWESAPLPASEINAQRAAGGAKPLTDAGSDLGGIPGAVLDAANSITDSITDPLAALKSIAAFFTMLGKWHTWMVLLEVVGGAALFAAGVVMVSKDQNFV